MIETPSGEPVGFLAHSPRLRDGHVSAAAYELKPGVSWLAVTPSVVRYLWALGEEWAAQDPKQEMERFAFWLGAEHPVYQVFDKRLPHTVAPYAWYVRVPDLPGFLRHVAPVLEQRLENSLLVGHSGELKISFYRSGLRLAFEGGRLVRSSRGSQRPKRKGMRALPTSPSCNCSLATGRWMSWTMPLPTAGRPATRPGPCWMRCFPSAHPISGLFPSRLAAAPCSMHCQLADGSLPWYNSPR